MVGFALSSRLRGKHARFVVRKPNAAQLAQIAELVDRGAIRPMVGRTYPLERVAEAHRGIETGRTRGKIVLDLRFSPRSLRAGKEPSPKPDLGSFPR
jgi:alcohol dehydrogenase